MRGLTPALSPRRLRTKWKSLPWTCPTRRAPEHLVGRQLGTVQVAVYGATRLVGRSRKPLDAWRWVAPDEGLPEHPTVRWRRKLYPKLSPALLVNSIGAVADAVEQGLGIAPLPVFLAQQRQGLRALSEPIPECETDLWLLTHPESRHLRRIAAVAEHFATTPASLRILNGMRSSGGVSS